MVDEVRHRLTVREAQPLDAVHVAALGDAERGGDGGGGRQDGVDQDLGRGALAGRLQVVVEAAQLQWALDLAVHHLRADTAAAHEQPLVDEGLDGLADGRPRQTQPCGQLDLVAQQAARGEAAVLDGGLQLLGELEVQRHRGATVHTEVERHGRVHIWFRHGPERSPVIG